MESVVAARVIFLFGLSICLGQTAADQPGERALTSANGHYRLYYRSEPEPIPLNQPFILTVRVEHATPAAEPFSLSVNARMPQHRHGMNTRPRVHDLGDGKFRVEGLLFHMAGRWELHFDISVDGVTTRAQDDVELD